MRGYHRPEEGAADFLEKFRRYSRGAGDSTVGWHKAYIYPGYLSTWVVSLGITLGRAQGIQFSSSAFVQTCTKLLSSPLWLLP